MLISIINRRKKQLRQRGVTLTETLLGVATLGVGLAGIAQLQIENVRQLQAETAAQQVQLVREAAVRYTRDRYGDLIGGALNADGNTFEIPQADLFADGYLPPTMSVGGAGNAIIPSPYNGQYVVTLRRDDDGGTPTISLLVGTTGGRALNNTDIQRAASLIGADGVFRPAEDVGGGAVYDTDNVTASYGGFEVAAADFGGDAAINQGSIGAFAFFGEGGVLADFLYRNPVPGQPEAQQMNANINANQFGIGNVTQIGGFNDTAVNGPLDSNPNMIDTGVAPDPIIATFSDDGLRVRNPDEAALGTPVPPLPGLATDNFTNPTIENTVRFGGQFQTGANPAYARGNANIQAGDAIFGIVDAEEAIRAQQTVSAADRAALGGQRATLTSGLDVDGAQLAGGAGALPTGFYADDDADISRRVALGFDNRAGVDSAGLTIDDAAADTNRAALDYGVDAAGAAQPDSGRFEMSDEQLAGNRRFRTDYGFNIDGTGAIADAGNLQVADRAGNNRLEYNYGLDDAGTAALATAGTLRQRDNAGTERSRLNYGVDDTGTANAAAGNFIITDQAAVDRAGMVYNGNQGVIAALDEQVAGQARFRADYGFDDAAGALADAGNVQAFDRAGQARVEANYGMNAAGGADTTAGNQRLLDDGGARRFESQYTSAFSAYTVRDVGNADRVVMDADRDETGAIVAGAGNIRLRDAAGDRFRQSYNGNTGTERMNDGVVDRFERTYDAGQTDAFIRDQGGNDRYNFVTDGAGASQLVLDDGGRNRYEFTTADGAQSQQFIRDNGDRARYEFNANGAQTDQFIRDNADRIRYQFTQNGNQSQEFVFDNGNRARYEFNAINGVTNQFVRDNADRARYEFTQNGVRAQQFIRDNGNLDRLEFDANGATTNLIVRDNANRARFDVQTAGGTTQLSMRDDGNIRRLQLNAQNGQLNAGDTATANQHARVDGNGSRVLANTVAAAGTAANFGGARSLRVGRNDPGTPARPGGLPGLTNNWSVLDVDDIYLRSRGIWMSQTTQFYTAATQNLSHGDATDTVTCATGYNPVRIVSPNYMAGPGANPYPGDNDILLTGVVPGLRLQRSFDTSSYHAMRSYIDGSDNLVIQGRSSSRGWANVDNARAIVTTYCFDT